MPKNLTADEVARFEKDGHTGPLRVMSAADAARYRARYEDFERRHPTEIRKLKTKAHLLCPWVDEIARHSRVLDAFEALIGPDILCYSMAFRVKEADGRTHAGWHQDTAYSQLRPILVIAALALGPCGPDEGCISVLPGSHVWDILPHRESPDGASILARDQAIDAPLDTANAVDLALAPGEMALFHYNIVHGSRANTSNDRRMVLLVEMMPASATQLRDREAAMLVRGRDRFGHFETDRPAVEEFGAAEQESWRRSVSLRAKVIFADSELAVSEAYGGGAR